MSRQRRIQVTLAEPRASIGSPVICDGSPFAIQKPATSRVFDRCGIALVLAQRE